MTSEFVLEWSIKCYDPRPQWAPPTHHPAYRHPRRSYLREWINWWLWRRPGALYFVHRCSLPEHSRYRYYTLYETGLPGICTVRHLRFGAARAADWERHAFCFDVAVSISLRICTFLVAWRAPWQLGPNYIPTPADDRTLSVRFF